MIRLFTALTLPPAIREELANLCYGIREARWVGQDQLHLTVRFIGEVNESQLDDIQPALASVNIPPFALQLRGSGFFPPRGQPRTLWIGVQDNPALDTLFARIDRALARIGIPREGRKFHPHLTIARFSTGVPVAAIMPFIAATSLFQAGPVEVSAFHLFSSTLTREGPIHRHEASFGLYADTAMPDDDDPE